MIKETNMAAVNEISLTKEEIYTLRLLTHNCSNKQIEDFFYNTNISPLVLEKSIEQKLNSTSLYDTIVKAIKLNILNEYDFVNHIAKRLCLDKAYFIFNSYSQTETNLRSIMLLNELKELIKTYDYQLDVRNAYLNLDLSKLEKNYLNMKFLKENHLDIHFQELNTCADNLNFSNSKIFSIDDKAILKKLESNSWYNAYIKGFELKIIKKTSYFENRTKKEVRNSKNKIVSIINLKKYSKKEKVFKIYRELVSLIIAVNKIY